MREQLEEIAARVKQIYREAVDGLDEKFAFEKRPTEGEVEGPPTVLLLGNHSSGKSTFINHLLGAPVQKTGLAPTDDAFTVLTFGAREEERDGQAVVETPSLPYAGLRHFGATLLSHLKMKLRPVSLLREVTLIDSPGMIDAAKEESGRGYDFPGVVRWFAERSDLVLVYFDPEKPGTTGETLQVFTQSLRGIDHKLLIVMNKMDQFRSLPDFARAYGALCWNLGKVIPRKDLPHIYTTFVPVEEAPRSTLPLEEFDKAREELVHEIKRAPARRVDNMITQLADHAGRLRVHAKIVDQARRDLGRFRRKLWGLLVAMVLALGLAGAVSITAGAKAWLPIALFAGAALLGYGGYFAIRGILKSEERQILAGLTDVFERVYARELLVRDRTEDLRALWASVHSRTRTTLERLGILSFRKLKSSEAERLDRALEAEIPELRSKLHRQLRVAVPT